MKEKVSGCFVLNTVYAKNNKNVLLNSPIITNTIIILQSKLTV